MSGKVWLVGAGPGAADLITVRGRDVLRGADAVVYDRLVPSMLLDEAPPHAERHYVGKTPGRRDAEQQQINALLVRLGGDGKQVVRLKGGDPFVFGRGGEEACALARAGIAWEVVPGISSAIAAAAFAGIPVTHRGIASSFAVTTGHVGLDGPAVADADTLVVLMAVENLAVVVGRLLAHGKAPNTPAALVRAASTPAQKTVIATLDTIVERARHQGIAPPATLVVGPTAALGHDLAWFRSGPLAGRRILLARTRSEPSPLAAQLRAAGAEVIEAPAGAVEALRDTADLDSAVGDLGNGRVDWVFFGGADAVAALWTRLDELGLDSRAIRARVCAFGLGTADALRARGVRADWDCPTYYAADVAAGLAERGARHVLAPQVGAVGAFDAAPPGGGLDIQPLVVARVRPPSAAETARLRALANAEDLDLVIFPASRSVAPTADLFDPAARARVRALCMGPRTAAAARDAGFARVHVAETASSVAVLDAASDLLAPKTTRTVTR